MGFFERFLAKNQALVIPFFPNLLMMRFLLILALQMQAAIISYFVYRLTYDPLLHKGNPVVLGMIGLWEVIPAVGFSLFSGHFVDISEKKKLSMLFITGYLVLSVFFAGIVYCGNYHIIPVNAIIWLVYGGIFVGGIIRSFLSPASFSLLGLILPKHLYANGSTWSSASWQIGAVLGPLLGGFMIALAGFEAAMICCSIVLIGSFNSISRIPKQAVHLSEKEPMLRSMGRGLKFVFGSQIIKSIMMLDMFAVLFGGAVALLPVYADDILNVGEIGFGWLRASSSIGSVIAMVGMSFLPVRKNPGLKMYACFIAFGLATVVFGYCGVLGSHDLLFNFMGLRLSYAFLLGFVMLLLIGVFDAINIVIRHTILQMNTPDNMRGRVAAVNTIFISSSNELGAMESGLTAKWMGTVPAVAFGGYIAVLVVFISWFAAPELRTYQLHEKHD